MSRPAGTYAIFETSQGNIVVRLLEKEAPKTVANFIGLAEGTKEFTNEKTGQKEKRPFYDGLIFHRVIPQFMIQGGCPQGSGMGGPGYKFADEFHPSLKHSKAGKLRTGNQRKPVLPHRGGNAVAGQQAHHLWRNRRRAGRGQPDFECAARFE
jgi:cyclophilin family peptidyl-prolyl cis-trans isomerase